MHDGDIAEVSVGENGGSVEVCLSRCCEKEQRVRRFFRF